MAAVARLAQQPPPHDGDNITLAPPGRTHAHTEIDYNKLHRGEPATQTVLGSQALREKNRKSLASQSNTMPQAISKMQEIAESVQGSMLQTAECIAKIENRVEQMPSLILEQVRSIVKEEVNREISALEARVTTMIREQVRSIV